MTKKSALRVMISLGRESDKDESDDRVTFIRPRPKTTGPTTLHLVAQRGEEELGAALCGSWDVY